MTDKYYYEESEIEIEPEPDQYQYQSSEPKYQYQSLDQIADINNCLSTVTNPIDQVNCIRTALGLPPVSSGNIPTIDNTTIQCLNDIFSKFHGPVDTTTGHMKLPFQSVLTMINGVRACVGLPTVPIPANVTCIMTNCLTGIGTTPTDISTCVKNCVSQNQVV